jgi:carboxyl-terminal processing protease
MFKLKRPVLLALTLLGLSVWLLFSAGNRNFAVAASSPYEDLRLFTDALALIRHSYVEEVDTRKLIYGGIRGMMQTLDPHSGFLPPDAYQAMQDDTRGEFGGVGIEVSMRDDALIVVAPIEDTPAFHAGVLAGDQILSIDQEEVAGLDIMQVISLLRGDAGSPVTLSLKRGDNEEPLTVQLERELIHVDSVKARLISPGYGYVRLLQFQERTDVELQQALIALRKQNNNTLDGLILDLRNNPGGLLDQSIKVADLFLDKGLVVYTEGRDPDSQLKYMAHQKGTEPDCPMVVLIDGGSASAAEIVAGALQDHKRAILLGTRSFGKGSVQIVVPMSDGSGLRLTTARYFTPLGRSIQALGIEPDIFVQKGILQVVSTVTAQREQDLKNHFSSQASDKKTSASPSDAPVDKDSRDDYQLMRALDLLKGWNFFGRTAPAA